MQRRKEINCATIQTEQFLLLLLCGPYYSSITVGGKSTPWPIIENCSFRVGFAHKGVTQFRDCCCSHIISRNQVRGHRTDSSHSGAEEYPRRKTQSNQRWYTHVSQLTQFMPPPKTYESEIGSQPTVRDTLSWHTPRRTKNHVFI